jgi:hypothetical protein
MEEWEKEDDGQNAGADWVDVDILLGVVAVIGRLVFGLALIESNKNFIGSKKKMEAMMESRWIG